MSKEIYTEEQEPAMFIKIEGNFVNVNKIKRIWKEDKKNQFGKPNGEYCLHVDMEKEYKGVHITYQAGEERDETLKKVEEQLRRSNRLC